VTSEPIQPRARPQRPDVTAAAVLHAACTPGTGPGRLLHAPRGDEPPAPVPLDVVRRRHAATPGAGATGASVSDHENLDWGLVAAFRTLVANRLAARYGGGVARRADERAPRRPTSGRIPMDRVRAGAGGLVAPSTTSSREHTADTVPPASGEAWTPQSACAHGAGDLRCRLPTRPVATASRRRPRREHLHPWLSPSTPRAHRRQPRSRDHRWPTATRS
jgi:hypothetical protein